MRKWIDEIAQDFVLGLFEKSKKETDLEKAKEVHDYISNLSPKDLGTVMNITEKDWNLGCAWREAEQCAYRLVWKFYEI